ncbi:MAG: biopolymer transporter ExbD [Saprospiraceae bacterium]
MQKKPRRAAPQVNAGSMADIAFLLLIFFLVTTTIAEDSGLLVRLPIWEEEPVKLDIHSRNIFSVLVNTQNKLLIKGEPVPATDIPRLLREHVLNPDRRADLPDKPTQAIVSLRSDRGTNYETYLAVYDQLKAGYAALWQERAAAEFGKAYDLLSEADQKLIRNALPMTISEAESTDVLVSR